MSAAEALDHVGIAGHDLAALAEKWQRLGFQLTPFARHSGCRIPDGPVVPFGTGNRCILLRHGYLELIAIVDPAAFSDKLETFLARYEGIQILALSIADEQATMARLRCAGIDIPGIAYLERPVDDSDPAGPIARFARLLLPDPVEGRIQLIRHLTPEAIWQERFLTHPNGAVGLKEVVLAVTNPADTAARLSRLAGRSVVPDPVGGFSLELSSGRVRMVPQDGLETIFPGMVVPCLPFIAGLALHTVDGNSAATRWFESHGVEYKVIPGALLVDATQTGGVAMRLEA